MKIGTALEEDFFNYFNENDKVAVRIKPKSGFDASELFQYLVLGGGLISIAQTVHSYLSLGKSPKKIQVQVGDETKLLVEGSSIEEIKELIEIASTIIIE